MPASSAARTALCSRRNSFRSRLSAARRGWIFARLVHVDVSHPRERALVEERRLDRRAPPRETLAEPSRGEEGVERLLSDTRYEVRLELARLEQEPRAEAPYVAVGDIRSVI
jgi:hypothetical protein